MSVKLGQGICLMEPVTMSTNRGVAVEQPTSRIIGRMPEFAAMGVDVGLESER